MIPNAQDLPTVAGRLAGKVALVSGAGDGMGRAAAQLFASAGAAVGVLEIDPERASETAAEINDSGGQALGLVADVSRADEVSTAIEKTVKAFGALHVLYNNAGVWMPGDGPVTELDPSVWERTLAVNLTGVFLCCRLGIPELIRAGGGSVINTSSPTAFRPEPDVAAYTSSKGGVVSLTLAIAQDYARFGVRANALMPGVTETTLVRDAIEDPAYLDYTLRVTPLGRLGQPQDVARVALFLASDESSFVTGSVVWADGGYQIGGRQTR